MKKLLTIMIMLSLACFGIGSSPTYTFSKIDTPKLSIHNNYWHTRQIIIFCDGSPTQFLRGFTFGAVDTRNLNDCMGYYSFRINNQWNSEPVLSSAGTIHLVIQPSLNLSTVYLSR